MEYTLTCTCGEVITAGTIDDAKREATRHIEGETASSHVVTCVGIVFIASDEDLMEKEKPAKQVSDRSRIIEHGRLLARMTMAERLEVLAQELLNLEQLRNAESVYETSLLSSVFADIEGGNYELALSKARERSIDDL